MKRRTSNAELRTPNLPIAAVLAAARDVTASLDLQTVLERILDHLQWLVPGHHAEVLLLTDSGTHLYVAACRGKPYPGWEEVRLPVDAGVCGDVVRRREGVIVPRVREDPRYVQRWPDIESEVAAPLVYGDRVLGVVNSESETPDAYGPADLETLALFASLAAVALENARLHEQALADNARLRELDRLRRALLAAVAHDYKNPLAVIAGGATLLRRELPDDERRHHLRVIEREALRLARLADDVLDYSRDEAGRRVLRRHPIDLAALIRRAAQMADLGRDGPEGWAIHLELPPHPVIVQADQDALRRVLANLLDNARKYTPGGGTVTVSLHAGPAEVEVRVADRGLGLAPAELERIFEPYHRALEVTTTIAGTGLGLAICRQLIEAHGGRVWAESDGPGLGSTFAFTLPVEG